MSGAIRTAMVLAAGLGTRLRPITDTIPKPLVEVGGGALIDRAIDRLVGVGVERVVVNLHYKGELIAAHLADRSQPRIELSREKQLLETGGGVKNALKHLDDYFFVINSDILWLDGAQPALARLAGCFDEACTDAALLLQRTVSAVGYEGCGDYFLDPLGRPSRRREHEVAPLIFSGIQVLHRRLFEGIAETVFSSRLLFDRAEAAGRLGAIVHDGEWYHVGTPDGLAATRARFASDRVER
jgi:MurNAc alpha-1-phosphate uridylyltransferase